MEASKRVTTYYITGEQLSRRFGGRSEGRWRQHNGPFQRHSKAKSRPLRTKLNNHPKPKHNKECLLYTLTPCEAEQEANRNQEKTHFPLTQSGGNWESPAHAAHSPRRLPIKRRQQIRDQKFSQVNNVISLLPSPLLHFLQILRQIAPLPE